MDFIQDFVPSSTPLPSPDPLGRARGQLNQGDNLFSRRRSVKLAMQSDGNLLYVIDDRDLPLDVTQGHYRTVIFATGTQGMGGDACVMQNDGNLVIYDLAATALWDSATQKNPGAFLRCQDDGNLVIFAPNGAVLWASNTFAGPRP
jgi:hypothetical protein